jgi:hydroxypyruvate reductase
MFEGRDAPARSAPHESEAHESEAQNVALACLAAGIEAAHPERVVVDAVCLEDDVLVVGDGRYDLSEFDEVVVVGGGKAADAVADALESVLGDRITGGAVVDTDPTDGRIERLRGAHPVPDETGVESTERVRDLVEAAGERTLVLAVVTGGASAVLPSPADGIGLDDLQRTTDALLSAGADIDEINAVRKHLSTLKGGGLARIAAPATVVGVVLSDVVGDDLSVVASGPTAPDESTYGEALSVLERYGVDPPPAVRERLAAGARGDLRETPTEDDPAFDRVTNHVVANGFTALSAARDAARERGYDACVLSSRIRGEAQEAAKTKAAVAEEASATGNPVPPPAVVLSGGETTVTVRGDGTGGPNLEYALSAALTLALDGESAVVGAVDTDGRDGGTDVAGAIVDGETVDDTDAARDALARNDALPFLRERGALLETGPTGTNVNDLRVAVVPVSKV